MASQVASKSTDCSTVYSAVHQRKHQMSTLLALHGGNPPVTGGFPSHWARNAENVSYHDVFLIIGQKNEMNL